MSYLAKKKTVQMSSIRITALEKVMSRVPVQLEDDSRKVSEFYGENVFDIDTMRTYLSEESFDSVVDAMENGTRINRKIADDVASSMKVWAMERGAKHYTHWFQPLTGATAEKHDAFFEPTSGGRAMEKFEGSQLVQQEPDASSFPNGGIRNTFEARGYTAWDPTSPAFIIDNTLCIPTIFVAYTGEALDYKAPLLKALKSIDDIATEVCKYFDKNVTKVNTTLGWEQEYFLVDDAMYHARPDLALTGRTLIGHGSAKNQQLDDHYFGTIPDRALAYMKDLERECYKLSIPVKTRHNEVAPTQFEFAPIFEECSVAVDHNQLLVDLMSKVAKRHHFKVLVHEKPYAGMNGSGKHNNWSLSTNTGVNLLSPGKNPKSALQFLAFFVSTIKAVHDYDDLLRANIASASNDHRLGANEAPPAIISVFIGSELTRVLDDIEARTKGGKMSATEKTELKLDIIKIPQILLDNTDRNRTSPFAFTGNKFEVRATGSSANCAQTMIALNSMVSKTLRTFKAEVDAKINSGLKKDEAIIDVIRNFIIETKRIRFEGDGYSDGWVEEAEKRGLSNQKTTPYALDFLITDKVKDLYTNLGVFTEVEIESRHHIACEQYVMKIQIEARVLGDLAINHIIPTAIKYQNTLIQNVQGLKDILGSDYKSLGATQIDTIKDLSKHIEVVKNTVHEMVEARKKANVIEDPSKQAKAYCDTVLCHFDTIRYHVDKLEQTIDDSIWPLPKYREMLFLN